LKIEDSELERYLKEGMSYPEIETTHLNEVTKVDNYEINYRKAGDNEWTVAQGKDGNILIENLEPDTLYWFCPRAHNSAGWSSFSKEASISEKTLS
jgi:Fibronectin type III domain.